MTWSGTTGADSREASTITATRLWVAGSYARGAEECGDLDLILEVSIEGAHPPVGTIGNALFGRAQDTSLFIGTPEKNSSYVTFPEARLIWSEAQADWRVNIAAMSPDPAATRFARPTDQLPLRPDQLAEENSALVRLLELKNQSVLTWTWVEAAEITELPDALENAGIAAEDYGAKTQEALRLAVSHFGWASSKRDWVGAETRDRLSRV